jgi:outer membrane protein
MNPKYQLGVLLLCLIPAAVDAGGIEVRLTNAPAAGTVVFVLYDSPNTFGDLRDPVLTVTEPLDGRERYVITNVPPSEYALLAYYDENDNGLIDRNFIGIPREPLGFSNNYQPKGPPSYARAAFVLNEGQIQQFDMELYKPLGRRGRVGIGPGIIFQSSPYRDYDDAVYQWIPAITYTGERLQWFGPRVQLGLVGSDWLRLAATGEYRIGPYEEDGSDYLNGMGDADDTLMAGLALQLELTAGVDLSIGGAVDALGEIGGFETSASLDKSFQFGILRVSPFVAINWMDHHMAENDFGVPAGKAVAGRPAYAPDGMFSYEAGSAFFVEVTTSILIVGNAGVERLGEEAADSPIVEEEQVFKGFLAINYVF